MITKNILFVTGSRSDFATEKRIISFLTKDKTIKTKIFVTGPHTLSSGGSTFREIERLGYKIDFIQPIKGKSVSKDFIDEARAMDIFLNKNTVDAAVICGDRPEMLAAASILFLKHIPIFHIHGGEITNGGLPDDNIRHALSKLSSIHFVATKSNGQVLRRMGEEKWRIHKVGSPDLDEIYEFNNPEENILLKKYNLLTKKYALVLFHPEYLAGNRNAIYAQNIVSALKTHNINAFIIGPNSDPFSENISKVFKKVSSDFAYIPSLDRKSYLSLLKNCDFLIGNSSSGIIEAASFKIPVINLGNRQEGRERNKNVIDVREIKPKNIVKAMNKIRTPHFQKALLTTRNVFGDGGAGQKIEKILIKILKGYNHEKLVHKKFEI